MLAAGISMSKEAQTNGLQAKRRIVIAIMQNLLLGAPMPDSGLGASAPFRYLARYTTKVAKMFPSRVNQRPPKERGSQAVAGESMGSLAAFSGIALALIRLSAARTTSLARLRVRRNSPKLRHQFRQTGCRTTSDALARHPPGHRRGSYLLTWY